MEEQSWPQFSLMTGEVWIIFSKKGTSSASRWNFPIIKTIQPQSICDSVEPLENGVYLAAVMTGQVFIEGDLLWAVAKETEPDIFFLSLRVAGQSPYYFTVGVGEDEDYW